MSRGERAEESRGALPRLSIPNNQISYRRLVLRRRRPAKPTIPEPNIIKVLGSGTELPAVPITDVSGATCVLVT